MKKNTQASLPTDVETIEFQNIKPQIGVKYYYLHHRLTDLVTVVKDSYWNDYDSDVHRLVSGNFFLDEKEANKKCIQRNLRFMMIKKQIKK